MGTQGKGLQTTLGQHKKLKHESQKCRCREQPARNGSSYQSKGKNLPLDQGQSERCLPAQMFSISAQTTPFFTPVPLFYPKRAPQDPQKDANNSLGPPHFGQIRTLALARADPVCDKDASPGIALSAFVEGGSTFESPTLMRRVITR
jgi:hypothetical protein